MKRGITLIEMMTMVAIIAIIAEVIIPGIVNVDKSIELSKAEVHYFVKYDMKTYKIIKIDGDMFTLEDANGNKEFVYKTEKVEIISK